MAALAICAPGAAAATGPALTVDPTSSDHHAISPNIYGLNFADPTLGAAIGLPVDRWGGNGTDTYNWQLGSQNLGSDWYFENVADCFAAAYNWCSGMTKNTVFAYRDFIAKDRKLGSKTLITLPMAGYVAKNAPVAHPLTCGYPKTPWPNQDSFDPYDSNCGNGRQRRAHDPGQPANDGRAIGASYDGSWVTTTWSSATAPPSTTGVGYYELGQRTVAVERHAQRYPPQAGDRAGAVAEVGGRSPPPSRRPTRARRCSGFSEWGWPGYFCTERRHASATAAIRTAAPPRPTAPTTATCRWPSGTCGSSPHYDATTEASATSTTSTSTTTPRAVNSTDVTRSLWDPTYTDPSWINSKIQLIPRMNCWISGHVAGLCPNAGGYPGTKISLSEYNLSLSGVSARPTRSSRPTRSGSLPARASRSRPGGRCRTTARWSSDAFLMFRDYDGNALAVRRHLHPLRQRQPEPAGRVRRAALVDGAYTILVLNKTSSALTSRLTLTGSTEIGPVSDLALDGRFDRAGGRRHADRERGRSRPPIRRCR